MIGIKTYCRYECSPTAVVGAIGGDFFDRLSQRHCGRPVIRIKWLVGLLAEFSLHFGHSHLSSQILAALLTSCTAAVMKPLGIEIAGE